MFRVDLRTSFALRDTSPYRGLVTWFEGTVVLEDGDSGAETTVGTITMALVHVNEARRRGALLLDVLADDSSELEALHNVYFEGNDQEDTFTDAPAGDLLYIADITIADEYDREGLDLQVVESLRTSIGSACRLLVIPHASPAERAYWAKLGFLPATPGAREGLMHWQNSKLDTPETPKRRKPEKPPKPRAHKAARRH